MGVCEQEPVIKAIKAAEDRLTNSTNFLRFLGQAALLPREDLPRVISADDLQEGEEPYDFLSLALNLGNTFLYMVCTSLRRSKIWWQSLYRVYFQNFVNEK